MKKIILIWFCCILCGCSLMHGSFEKGNIDMDYLISSIQQEIEKKQWNYGILQNESLKKDEIESLYHIPAICVDEAYVYQGVIPLQFNEIAFFKINKKYEKELLDGIEKRKKDLENRYSNIDIDDVLKQCQQGSIGEYYYFILGEDAEKVVNYIKGKK